MTPLREKMIRTLELHRLSADTVKAYVSAVADLARFHHRSPDQLSREQVQEYFHDLIVVKKLSYSTCNQRLCAINFLHRHVLGQAEFDLKIPLRRSGRLPVPFSRTEIAKLLEATNNLKHRVMLMTTYGTGVRSCELVRLEPRDIHSDRMLIHVRNGKGHKTRFTLLSGSLLECITLFK